MRLEKHMEKLAADKAEIEQKMADPELYEGSWMAVCMQKDLGWISQQLAEPKKPYSLRITNWRRRRRVSAEPTARSPMPARRFQTC